MSRQRYVYRATALYDDCLLDTTRHFLTKKSRDLWARQRLQGYPVDTGTFFEGDRPAIPPAREVKLARSQPVVFEEDHETPLSDSA